MYCSDQDPNCRETEEGPFPAVRRILTRKEQKLFSHLKVSKCDYQIVRHRKLSILGHGAPFKNKNVWFNFRESNGTAREGNGERLYMEAVAKAHSCQRPRRASTNRQEKNNIMLNKCTLRTIQQEKAFVDNYLTVGERKIQKNIRDEARICKNQ